MATDSQGTGRAKPYRIDVNQFHQMIVAGVFPDSARVELLGGLLVRRRKGLPPHNFSQQVLAGLLKAIEPRDRLIVENKPVEWGRYWRAEPDLSLLVGPLDRYRARTPIADDVRFLVEVSDASYPTDRGIKWRGYASAGVPTYWIVNLTDRRVEVYRDPTGKGRSASYRSAEVHGVEDSVSVIIEGVEVGRIAVKDIMP